MPADKTDISFPEIELPDEGEHRAKILDVRGPNENKKYEQTQYEIDLLLDDGLEQRIWATNTWWGGKPQPSKLYELCTITGVDDDGNPPDDINDLIDKTLKVIIKHEEDSSGIARARVTDFLKDDETEEQLDEVIEEVDKALEEEEEEEEEDLPF